MHAQATSDCQNVSTLDDIQCVRRLSALSSEAATPHQQASCTSFCLNSTAITTSTSSCQICVPLYNTIVTAALPTQSTFTSSSKFAGTENSLGASTGKGAVSPCSPSSPIAQSVTANTPPFSPNKSTHNSANTYYTPDVTASTYPPTVAAVNTYNTANTEEIKAAVNTDMTVNSYNAPNLSLGVNTSITANSYNTQNTFPMTPNTSIPPNLLGVPSLPLLNTLCTKAQEDAANQNRCRWVVKNFGQQYTGSSSSNNSNGNSRGNLSSKGNCCIRRRLMDEEGYIRRAACICVNKEETKVLLISSKKDPCVWLVPGGGLEAGEEPIAAAKREAWEEAGIQGYIVRYLGLFESCHHSGLKKHRTAVYIFVVTEEHTDYPEATLGRRRQWFSLDEALLHLARNRPLQSAYLQLLMMSKLKVVAAS